MIISTSADTNLVSLEILNSIWNRALNHGPGLQVPKRQFSGFGDELSHFMFPSLGTVKPFTVCVSATLTSFNVRYSRNTFCSQITYGKGTTRRAQDIVCHLHTSLGWSVGVAKLFSVCLWVSTGLGSSLIVHKISPALKHHIWLYPPYLRCRATLMHSDIPFPRAPPLRTSGSLSAPASRFPACLCWSDCLLWDLSKSFRASFWALCLLRNYFDGF